MTQTDKDEWVHIQCAFFISGLYFSEPNCGGIVIYKKDLKLHNETCFLCKKKVGLTLRCNHKGCKNIFHVTCGQSKRFTIVMDNNVARCWCSEHTPKQYRENRYKQLQKDDEKKFFFS